MKFYAREKVFSFRDRFTVWDEAGNERYFVEGELFRLGRRLHIADAAGREVAQLRQHVFTLLPRFDILVGGVVRAQIVKEFTFFKPSYRIEGKDWQVQGDFFAHNYSITERGVPVASIRKEWLTWGDCYEFDIADRPNDDDELTALAAVLAIDCVTEDAAAAASAANNN